MHNALLGLSLIVSGVMGIAHFAGKNDEKPMPEGKPTVKDQPALVGDTQVEFNGVKFDSGTIVCRQVNVVDEKGRAGITLYNRGSTRGIWLDGPKDGQGVAIVSTSGQPAFISVYDVNAKNYKNSKSSGFQWAVSLDKDGKPTLQLMDEDGNLKFVDFSTLK